MLAPTRVDGIERIVKQHLDAVRPRIQKLIETTPAADDHRVVCRIRTAFPYKFMFLLGIACYLLRGYSEEVQRFLGDNFLDEIKDDHPGMAITSIRSAGVTVDWKRDEEHLEPVFADIRKGLSGPNAGKLVIAILATIEDLALDFTPDMMNRAKRLGASNLRFWEVHGIADIQHAEELRRATAVVFADEEVLDEPTLVEGIDLGTRLIERMYAPAG